jgi:hypothetical protein
MKYIALHVKWSSHNPDGAVNNDLLFFACKVPLLACETILILFPLNIYAVYIVLGSIFCLLINPRYIHSRGLYFPGYFLVSFSSK